MPDVAAERTLPHSLDAEKSVLGAILDSQRGVQPRRRAHRRARFLSRRAPPHLQQHGGAQRAQRSHRLRHAQGGAVPHRATRRGRRPGLHRVAGRRRAAFGERRVLLPHRQREVDAQKPDPLRQQDPHRGLRGGTGAGPPARRGGARDLRHRRRSHPRRFRSAARPRAEQLRDDREAAAAQGPRHRRADRLRRPRRDDLGPPALRPRARRGTAVDGEDELRAQRRRSTSARRPT